MGARRFGPDIGSFLQRDFYSGALADLSLTSDPLTGNRYSLAGGNPVSFVEWDGHKVIDGGGARATDPNPGPPPTTSGGDPLPGSILNLEGSWERVRPDPRGQVLGFIDLFPGFITPVYANIYDERRAPSTTCWLVIRDSEGGCWGNELEEWKRLSKTTGRGLVTGGDLVADVTGALALGATVTPFAQPAAVPLFVASLGGQGASVAGELFQGRWEEAGKKYGMLALGGLTFGAGRLATRVAPRFPSKSIERRIIQGYEIISYYVEQQLKRPWP
jgi:hypothetical protein